MTSLWPFRRLSIAVVAGACVWVAGHAAGIGFPLRESKEELKMNYDFTVTETVSDPQRGIVLVNVELVLADEGRLKPLDDVQLVVMRKEPFKDGGYGADLVVSIDMKPTADGKRVGRVQIIKDWAERARVSLDTHTLDGKHDPLTRLHHEIPIAKYLKPAPAAAVDGPRRR